MFLYDLGLTIHHEMRSTYPKHQYLNNSNYPLMHGTQFKGSIGR